MNGLRRQRAKRSENNPEYIVIEQVHSYDFAFKETSGEADNYD